MNVHLHGVLWSIESFPTQPEEAGKESNEKVAGLTLRSSSKFFPNIISTKTRGLGLQPLLDLNVK